MLAIGRVLLLPLRACPIGYVSVYSYQDVVNENVFCRHRGSGRILNSETTSRACHSNCACSCRLSVSVFMHKLLVS